MRMIDDYTKYVAFPKTDAPWSKISPHKTIDLGELVIQAVENQWIEENLELCRAIRYGKTRFQWAGGR